MVQALNTGKVPYVGLRENEQKISCKNNFSKKGWHRKVYSYYSANSLFFSLFFKISLMIFLRLTHET